MEMAEPTEEDLNAEIGAKLELSRLFPWYFKLFFHLLTTAHRPLLEDEKVLVPLLPLGPWLWVLKV